MEISDYTARTVLRAILSGDRSSVTDAQNSSEGKRGKSGSASRGLPFELKRRTDYPSWFRLAQYSICGVNAPLEGA